MDVIGHPVDVCQLGRAHEITIVTQGAAEYAADRLVMDDEPFKGIQHLLVVVAYSGG